MSYGLLWIELGVAWVLWLAMIFACLARLRRGFPRGILRLLASLPPLLFFGALAGLAGALKYGVEIEENWFGYFLSLFIVCLVLFVVVYGLARRSDSTPGATIAAGWRRGQLALAWLGAMAVLSMTLWNMMLVQNQQATTMELEAGATFSSLVPPAVPDSENAAPLYERAFEQIDSDVIIKGKDSPLGDDGVAADDPALVALVARRAGTIDLLYQAARLPVCRFDKDWSHASISLMLPELNDLRASALLLQAHARLASKDGQFDAAILDINTMYAVARHVEQEPVLVSALVGNGVESVATQTLLEVLPRMTKSEQLNSLTLPDAYDSRRAAVRALRGEACFGLDTFGRMESGELSFNAIENISSHHHSGDTTWAADVVAKFYPVARLFLFAGNMQGYRNYMDDLRKAASEPYFKSKKDLDDLMGGLLTLKKESYFNSRMVPALYRFVENSTRAEIDATAAQTAVAATRYRFEHGRLPTDLQELTPAYLEAVPTDQFDGNSIRITTRDNDWIIYSVGPDQQDDGGHGQTDTNPPRKTYDFVWKMKIDANVPETRPAAAN